MRNNKHYLIWFIFFLPLPAFAWQWMDLWQTRDQQGYSLLQSGDAKKAAQVFNNKNWQTVATYRSGNYTQAFKSFSKSTTSDGQYNAGNAAALMGHYPDAISAYDKAIALNPNNQDAIINREIIKKLQKQQKQDQKNQKNNPDEKSKQNSSQQDEKDNAKQKDQAQKQDRQEKSSPDQKQSKESKSENQEKKSDHQAVSKQQRQEEKNKQLLRGLADDPGGLLQQKFLRDYARRHGVEENMEQEVDYNAF